MGLIILIFLVAALILAPSVTICFFKNFWKSLVYCIRDLFTYCKYKKWRLVKTGEIIGFLGLFGKGKTLTMVHRLCTIYRAYDGLKVFCPRRKKWVTQRINIVSNVKLKNVPFVPFESLQQVFDLSERIKDIDDANDTLTATFFDLDEAGSELNSRAFKSNIDPLSLNAILTCRHYNMSFFYTAQRFGHVDALMRQVTSFVYVCDKRWRFQFLKKYDAWTLENAQNPMVVPCESISSWFVLDKDYEAYDTFDTVEKLKKDVQEGNMLSEDEILALRGNDSIGNIEDIKTAVKKSRRKRYLF